MSLAGVICSLGGVLILLKTWPLIQTTCSENSAGKFAMQAIDRFSALGRTGEIDAEYIHPQIIGNVNRHRDAICAIVCRFRVIDFWILLPLFGDCVFIAEPALVS